MNFLEEISKSDYETLENKSYYSDRELSALYVRNAFVLPVKYVEDSRYDGPIFGEGGVLDEKLNYIKNSAQIAANMRNRVSGGYSFDYNKVKTVHSKVIYMNYFIHQWGHFLIDVINRLWFAVVNKDFPIVYTSNINENDIIAGNYLELLKLLGVDEERLILVNEVTQFDEVIIPDASIIPGDSYTKEYTELFSTIVKNCHLQKSGKGKIYCSRALLDSKKESGEYQIETIYNRNGYVSVNLETMTLKEQISALNQAKEIAMVNGSLAHNLLFVKSNPLVTIINKTYRINLHQFLIDSISQAKIIYVDAYISPMPVLYGRGPFIIRITPEFLSYCQYMGYDISGIRVNTKLSTCEKAMYYLHWVYSYKWYLLKHRKIEEGGFDKDYSLIREQYRKSQNMGKKRE